MGAPDTQNLRQLAAEAGVSLPKVRELLRAAEIEEPHPNKGLDGRLLRRIRRALGLGAEPGTAPAKKLTRDEMDARILLPLLRKGKVGSTKTTPIENTYGHGVPDDQKADAKDRVEELIKSGVLLEKQSQSRRHVYLSPKGRELATKMRAAGAEG